MIITPESPLRRLPIELAPKLATFFDGIRYAVDMMDLAYARLTNSLLHRSCDEENGEVNSAQQSFVEPFLDAWSIVDSLHRLRGLFDQLPGFKKNTIPYQLFVRKTELASELRNIIQHLNQSMNEFADCGKPVYGAIDWVTIMDAATGTLKICAIVSGRAQTGEYQLCNPAGKEIHYPVDHVTIQCADQRLSISDAVRSIKPVVGVLEDSLRQQYQVAKTQAADAFMCVTSTIGLERK